jgi:hypothetical protein
MSRPICAALFRTSFCLVPLALASSVFAEARSDNRRAAENAVQEALQREIYGLPHERQQLLASAQELSPQFAPARWHQGLVRDARNRWVPIEDFVQEATSAAWLRDYYRARSEAPDTADGQYALAQWCRQRGLAAQQRAHLSRVIELAPDHEAARRELGFVRAGPLWLSREEIEGERELARQREASLARWRATMEEIARGLASDSPARMDAARARLLALDDPSAIWAMEQVVSADRDDSALAVIDALAAMEHPEASLSLARHAVYYPTLRVREAAATALKERDPHSFVPELLALMVSPVDSRIAVARLPSGRIGYRHAFAREGSERRELLVLDTEFQRIFIPSGIERATRARALADLQRTALAREQLIAAMNQQTQQFNERITWVLNTALGQQLAAKAEDWWKWWDDYNQVQTQEGKRLVRQSDFQRRVYVDVPTRPAQRSTGDQGSGSQSGPQNFTFRIGRPQSTIPFGGFSGECLVAGTLVWTARGPTAVEEVQRGDLVLSQDVETGELAFKPVLRTTTRPVGKTVTFTAGPETFACSGGHVFWVSGEGWRKASELESGMLLHTSGGPTPIVSLEEGNDAATYNLIVADFATYFIGQQKILSHDFTPRQATSALVPGLKPQ